MRVSEAHFTANARGALRRHSVSTWPSEELETECLICGATFEAAPSDCADARPMGSVQLRGRDRAVEVFALGKLWRRLGAHGADARPM